MNYAQTFGINKDNKGTYANLIRTIAILDKLLYHQLNEEIDEEFFEKRFRDEMKDFKKLQNQLNVSVETMKQLCEQANIKISLVWENIFEIDKKEDLGMTHIAMQAGNDLTHISDMLISHIGGPKKLKISAFQEHIDVVYGLLRACRSEEDMENIIKPQFQKIYNFIEKSRPDDTLPDDFATTTGNEIYRMIRDLSY